MVNDEESRPASPVDIATRSAQRRVLLFPGRELIDEELWWHAQAVPRRNAPMTDERVPAVFEFDGVRARVDVLERLANGASGLREVKSSARPKDNHFDEIAFSCQSSKRLASSSPQPNRPTSIPATCADPSARERTQSSLRHPRRGGGSRLTPSRRPCARARPARRRGGRSGYETANRRHSRDAASRKRRSRPGRRRARRRCRA
jgi:hypothetical protein